MTDAKLNETMQKLKRPSDRVRAYIFLSLCFSRDKVTKRLVIGRCKRIACLPDCLLHDP